MGRVRLAGVALGAVASLGMATVLPGGRAGARQEPTLDDPDEFVAEARGVLRALERLAATFPTAAHTPAELAAQVRTHEPPNLAEALTSWIADSVAWLPYRGALRGARGVLIERRGNGLDQSLLLAESLAAAGLQVRLARAELPPRAQSELHVALRTPRTVEPPPVDLAGARRAELVDAAEALEVPVEDLERLSTSLELEVQRYLERVLPMTATQTAALRDLLAVEGVTPPALDVTPDARERALLRDHWWVQSSIDGVTWADHDPLAQRAGLVLEVEASTMALDELPSAEEHGLRLRVVAERVGPQGIETAVALEHEARARDLVAGHLRLEFVPLNAVRLVEEVRRSRPAGAPADSDHTLLVAERENEWLPALVVVDRAGTETPVVEASIRTDGSLNRKPALDLSARPGATAAVITGLGALSPATSDPVAHLTAVWFEYELRTPGAEPRTIRRNVFDLLGEARRAAGDAPVPTLTPTAARSRGLALMGATRILPQAGQIPPLHAMRVSLSAQIRNQRALVEHGAAAAAGEPGAFATLLDALATPPLELWMLAQQRLAVGRHVERVFLSELNLLASHVQPLPAERFEGLHGQDVVYASAIDVIANRIDVLAPSPGDDEAEHPWLVRLEQGVLDTVVENVALTGLDPAPPTRPVDEDPRMTLDNTAMLMLEVPPSEWTALGSDTPLSATNDTLTRVAEALATRHAVLLPGAAEDLAGMGSTSWWRVDVESGHTLGIGPRGWGQSVEYVVHQARVARTFASPGRRLGVTILCRALVGASAIGYLAGAGAIGGVGTAIWGEALGPAGYAGWGMVTGTTFGAMLGSGAMQTVLALANARCQLSLYGRSSGSMSFGPNSATSGTAATLFR